MKFVQRDLGEAAEVSSGGGSRGLRKEIVTLLILVAVAMTVIYFAVVLITEAIVSQMSPQEEARMFNMGSSDIPGVTAVPKAMKEKFELCEEVLEKLKAFEEVPDIEYTMVYMDDLVPNAFAIPGGKIAVTRGLLDSLDTEIAIAFVLGHELGHFAQRDHLRGLGRKIGFTLCVQILFGGTGGGQIFTNQAAGLVTASYSRGQESSADDFGLRCVGAIYGETDGTEAFFQVLEKDSSLPRWAYMFSTHPDNKSRIEKILRDKKRKKAE